MLKKIEIILSSTALILGSVQNNIPHDPMAETIWIGGSNIKELSKFNRKIDLLIVDENFTHSLPPLHLVQTILNLTATSLRDDEIRLIKPFKLSYLLNIIQESRTKKQLFCSINSHWIYNQQLALLQDSYTKIKLTSRENEVFSALLLCPEYKMDKEALLRQVWQYHPDTDSNTIETNLYRLKQKLPSNIMQIKDNYYQLMIENIS